MFKHIENHFLLPSDFNLLKIENKLEQMFLKPNALHRAVDFYYDSPVGDLFTEGALLRIRKKSFVQYKGAIERDSSTIDQRSFFEKEFENFESANKYIQSDQCQNKIKQVSYKTKLNFCCVAKITSLRQQYIIANKSGYNLPISIMVHDYVVINNRKENSFNKILEIKPLTHFYKNLNICENTMKHFVDLLFALSIDQSNSSKYHLLDYHFLFDGERP